MSPVAEGTIRRRSRIPGRRMEKKREQQRAWLWVLLLFVCAVLTALLALSLGRQSDASAVVPRSAQRRSPLEGGGAETLYVTDRVGWLEENRGQAEAGLRYFYEKTGVQPHIYVRGAQNPGISSPRENLDNYGAALYGSLFNDEAHLLIIVEEKENGSILQAGFAPGKQALSVMDQEAMDILRAYWKTLLEDSRNLAEGQKAAAIGEVLEKTADNIMMVKNTGGWLFMLALLTGGILLLAVLEFRRNWMRIKSETQNGK